MKFFKGIFQKNFFIERRFNPGPCQCFEYNHETTKDANFYKDKVTLTGEPLKEFIEDVCAYQTFLKNFNLQKMMTQEENEQTCKWFSIEYGFK